jgi:UDP-glucose 4-epimerase
MALLNRKEQLSVLVTGNRGFVGTNLIKKLKNKVHIVPAEQSNHERIDILIRNQLLRLENTDIIIHLASKTSIPNSTTNPYEYYQTNILGTLNILDFARQNNMNKIINISTYVYGKPNYFPINENHPINPHSPYTKSKVIAEKLSEFYAQDYGIDVVTLRPFYIYGPSQNELTFIPSIIKQMRKNGKVILSSRNTKRDFLFVDDFIDLVYKLILNFPKGYNTYNVGFGKSYPLERVVEIIRQILNINVDIEYNSSMRPNDIVDMVADITQLEKLYDWKPQIDIETGLRLTLNDSINKIR